MAQGPSDTILVAIWITLRIRESKVRNPDPPDRQRFVLCECILVFLFFKMAMTTVLDFKKCKILLADGVRRSEMSHACQISPEWVNLLQTYRVTLSLVNTKD